MRDSLVKAWPKAGQLVSLSLFIAMSFMAISPADAKTKKSKPTAAKVSVYVTRADQSKLLQHDSGLKITTGAATTSDSESIIVNSDERFQTMVGFGAAITDASAYVIRHNLKPTARKQLIRDLFSQTNGIGFSFTRLTIGASDFSRTHYSYNDMPKGQVDTGLKGFDIAPMRHDVLPVLKAALKENKDLLVMASPWSPPGWMKTTDSLIKGTLKPQYYDSYARYMSLYIRAMQDEGIPIYAITLQNEPHFEPTNYPGMRLEPKARADIIANFIGPQFKAQGFKTKILDWDHNWNEPESPKAVLADPRANSFTDGVAWHCYGGSVEAQLAVAKANPDKETYFTECSGGDWAPKWDDNLIWNAKTLVVESTRYYAKGVIMWNLALDEKAGPHLGGCNDCRAIVTINSKTGAITRNVEYYAMAHASRFVRPGAVRIGSSQGPKGLDHVAFENPDKSLVLILVNSDTDTKAITIKAAKQSFAYKVEPRSLVTLVWRP